MKIEFYFDPSCPFSWITSRWLLIARQQRDVEVEWKTFSLALKNDELEGGSDSPHASSHRASHRVLRIMQAAQPHGVSMIDLYTAFGVQFHVAGRDYDDGLIAEVLSEQDLSAELINAADDANYDDELRASINSATQVAGDDVGVPIIVFVTDEGERNGFFGPVLQSLPDNDEALKLWDGLNLLATDKNFYELKRSRPGGNPDVASTARC